MKLVCLLRPVLRLQVLPCLALPRLASSCLVLLRLVAFLWRLVLSCLALSCPVLPCLALCFFALPCVVLLFCFEVPASCDWLVLQNFMLPLFSQKNG